MTDQIGLAQVNITVEEGTPIINITSPEDGKLISYKVTTNFIGNATDPQDGNISNLIVWTSSINGTLGIGNSINKNLAIGTHTITGTVIDSHGNSVSSSVVVTVKEPQYPITSIISPRNTQSFTHGDNITFWSSYSDFEDGTLTNASLIWKSSIDGVVGNGTLFTRYNFSIGNHTFYFNVTDSDNLSSADFVGISFGQIISDVNQPNKTESGDASVNVSDGVEVNSSEG
ncbi:hypothetical protein HYV84_00095 [Candidatus Woesearchaeota archaeon]|nr:hypothetical protein [Candidatus Woesearchaeota archaeon]